LSALSIVSRRRKAGVGYKQYGCSARHSRGPAACANKTSTSELGLNAAVLRVLRSHLASPSVEEWVAEVVVAARAAERREPGLADEVRASETRVERVADALACIGFSETLARKLKDEEAKLSELRKQLARAVPAGRKPKVSVAQVVAALGGLEALALKRPEQARAALSAVVESVVLTPGHEGKVRATLQIKEERPPSRAAALMLKFRVAGAGFEPATFGS